MFVFWSVVYVDLHFVEGVYYWFHLYRDGKKFLVTGQTTHILFNGLTVKYGQCYYPSMRTENKGLLVLFSVRHGRCIDDNFKSEIMGTAAQAQLVVQYNL